MTSTVRDYLKMARESLREAEHLISADFPRGTANRAYYAMFYAASSMLLNEGEEFESPEKPSEPSGESSRRREG